MESTYNELLTISDAYGIVPQSRTGPSITLIDNNLLMFGGRTFPSLNLSNQIESFDLNTSTWNKQIVMVSSSSHVPLPRYFHSACNYKDRYLVVVGGQQLTSSENSGFELLNDICIFDSINKTWEVYEFSPEEFKPRYAQLTYINNNNLVIIGGQDEFNEYIQSIQVFDLETKRFKFENRVDTRVGGYRSACVFDPKNKMCYVYSNLNFSNVNRELFAVDEEYNLNKININIEGSESLPPGLRFPRCEVVDKYLLLSGIYLSSNVQSYSIWKFDLTNAKFSKIRSEGIQGSFGCGFCHHRDNQFVLFGQKDRNFVKDYEERRVNFTNICKINLEGYGILRSPPKACPKILSLLGEKLLSNPVFGNLELITEDNYVIKVNHFVLKARWPMYQKFVRSKEVDYIVLNESVEIVKLFAEHMYTLSLEEYVLNDHLILENLLEFSFRYQINILRDFVCEKLKNLLNIDNAVNIYNIADKTEQIGLRYCSLKVLVKNKKLILENNALLDKCSIRLVDDLNNYFPIPSSIYEKVKRRSLNKGKDSLKTYDHNIEMLNPEFLKKIDEEPVSKAQSIKSGDISPSSGDNFKKSFLNRFIRRPSVPLVNLKSMNNRSSNKVAPQDVGKFNRVLNQGSF